MKIKILTMITAFLVFSVLLISGCGEKTKEAQTSAEETEVIRASVEETEELESEDGKETLEVGVEAEVDIEMKTDCGGMDCFKERFSECKPATATLKVMEDLAYHYEIIGKKDGFCEVKHKFTSNPNPDFVGKEMVCKYSGAGEFSPNIQNADVCEGELYTLMTEG